MHSGGGSVDRVGVSYDLAAFGLPVYRHDQIDQLLLSDRVSSGIHTIVSPDGVEIDFLFQGFDFPASFLKRRSVLVAFTAAVPARTGKKAPFFSGMNLGRGLGLPVIAVADPTLALDGDLPLGWYAGNQSVRDLPLRIAQVLDALALRFNLRLVMLGGSNGGFAALVQATLVNAECCSVVWNPQTSISKHVWWRVIGLYAKVAFPDALDYVHRIPKIREDEARSFYYRWFDSEGIVHDVSGRALTAGATVIYLQNESDEHLQLHAAPYFHASAWRRLGRASFSRVDGRVGVYFGRWGEGHVMPPRAIIDQALKLAASGQAIEQSMASIETLDGGDQVERFDWLGVDGISADRVKIQRDGDTISIVCEYSDELIRKNELQFAFYLLLDGVRVSVVWYRSDPTAILPWPSSKGSVEVVSFVRDRLGMIASCRMKIT